MKPRFSIRPTLICLLLWPSRFDVYFASCLLSNSPSLHYHGEHPSFSMRECSATVSANEESALDASCSGNYREPSILLHMDMKRVLQSRKQVQEQAPSLTSSETILSLSPLERRRRPHILEEDIDGVIRVTSMLRAMVDNGVATEESFQIVLEAIGKRGRLRWMGKDHAIVCAADEAEDLIQELWQRQDGKLSTHTCNLALQAYAACSTPRGDRQYAQKAQRLLNDMVQGGIDPNTASFSHVIKAWAWQQGNLQNGICAQMAMQNFEKLMELSPDDKTLLQAYDLLLEAWSKSPLDDAPQQAERILDEMKKVSKNSSIISLLPNSQSYTNAILARTKSGAKDSAVKAHKLLFDYIESYENGELRTDSQPELFAFSKCMLCQRDLELNLF